ncbi:MAG: diguanylate cyclase, partial [Desulfobulbaceae bacterium]|nr:diguanylate cyclase [Desulfobulbaceae bacterium]
MEREKILIVDDQPANLLSLEAVLDVLEIDIRRANSGKEALEIAYHEELALILLDVQMPEMDGFETAEYLKQVKKTRDIPIIFITAISKEEKHVFKGYSAGAVDYIFKPFDTHLLTSKVKVFLQLDRSKRELSRKAAELEETVSKLKLTRKNLEKSQQSLENAQKIAKLGNWALALKTNEFSCSTEIYRLFGFNPDQPLTGYGQLLAAVPVEERAALAEMIDRAIAMAAPYSLEHRIIHTDGSERIVLEIGEIFFSDPDHRPEFLISTVHDITQWRQAEDRLQLIENVLNNAHEGVILTDAGAVIQSINPAFTEITGYTDEEAIGKKPNLLKSDHHDKWFYENMWKELIANGKWHGEIWNRRKNGEPYPQILSITAVRGRDHRINNYIGVFADISDLKRGEEALRYQADHDALTGLPNRNLFMDRLRQAMAHNGKTPELAVLILGLDQFKKVNDSLGPGAGDLLLQEVAERAGKLLTERYSFSRLGGDEYALLLIKAKQAEEIARFATELTDTLFRPFHIQDHELHVTASLGISIAPHDSLNPETLFKNANLAMHRAKERGRNQYQFFTPAMDAAAAKRLRLESDMRKGMERREFFLLYQPKIHTATGRVVGMEALVRWQHPESGFISPADFIPLAEETGLIIPLGIWILRDACLQTMEWLTLQSEIKVSVNLSTRQFHSPTLIDDIEAVLRETGFPAACLEL